MAREKQVTREKVRHLAWLSRIKISKAEERKYVEEMNEILRYFRKLDDIDTTGVPPTYHVADFVNVMRDDEPQPNLPNQLLGIVPARKGRFVKAPRIV
ncbi:MAG: Asp-tRNA(Asn)/Glu-tRNA(Gln) amidotransferase subunit GatC [Candidatus Bathyarchaeia archaeon]